LAALVFLPQAASNNADATAATVSNDFFIISLLNNGKAATQCSEY
jgi:hypothetical protein